MKVLLTGGKGMLGRTICRELTDFEVIPTDLPEADITVDKNGRGDFLSLEKALQSIDTTKPTTIQILGGEWTKPELPKKSKVQFVMRMGATWK